jgi:DGQHR domain-containing protein
MSNEAVRTVVRRRAIRLEQTGGIPLYLFSLTGDELLKVADISRVSRDDAGKLIGYQRAAVRQHVAEIVEYLNSEQPLFPNSIILALSSEVRFVRSRGPHVEDGLTSAGTIEIEVPRDGERRPAWIVDGQQRALAISLSKRKDLPVAINAFVADRVDLQRDQFIRINNTKPLPKGLISELLPDVDSQLPTRLAAKKLPSALCDVLAHHPQSPFRGIIRRPSMTAKERADAAITDTSLLKMLEESAFKEKREIETR